MQRCHGYCSLVVCLFVNKAPILEELKGVRHNRHLLLFNDMVVCARRHKDSFRIQWYVELLNSQIAELKSTSCCARSLVRSFLLIFDNSACVRSHAR